MPRSRADKAVLGNDWNFEKVIKSSTLLPYLNINNFGFARAILTKFVPPPHDFPRFSINFIKDLSGIVYFKYFIFGEPLDFAPGGVLHFG